jgi:hypothetical protein
VARHALLTPLGQQPAASAGIRPAAETCGHGCGPDQEDSVMKHSIGMFGILCVCTLLAGPTVAEVGLDTFTLDPQNLPKVGDAFTLDGSAFVVAGVGTAPYEYTATGESLVLKIDGISGTMVLVPAQGAKLRVDPGVPMVWVDGAEKADFKSWYLKTNAKGRIFLLLEYKR